MNQKPERAALLERITAAKAEKREILAGGFHGTAVHASQRLAFLRHELAVGNDLLRKFYPEKKS